MQTEQALDAASQPATVPTMPAAICTPDSSSTIANLPLVSLLFVVGLIRTTLSGEKPRQNHLGASLAGISGGKNVGTP